ncbi:MAG: NAD(P)-dependent oxidoreductase [Deltaproteobacteria bacterium]|nr:NAD(P)-dependent oxidoreductase [Deltaproteobacteria bacterium]
MSQPRIVVTGATGFIGRALCTRIGDRGTWLALGRSAPPPTLPVLFRTVDLSKPLPKDVIPDGTDVLVHLAAHRGADNDVAGHFRGTAAATLNLSEAARRAGVKRMVLASSTSVYEPALPASRTLLEEDRRVHHRPLAYGFAKKWAEDAARLSALLEPVAELWTLRIGMAVGPTMREQSWMRTTLRRLQAGEPYPLVGERGHHLGLVALDDVTEALIHAIAAPLPSHTLAPGPVWNVVGEAMWERDVVEHLAASLGVTPQFVEPTAIDPFGWTDQPWSVAGDGGRWLREAGGIRPRPVRPVLDSVVRAHVGG